MIDFDGTITITEEGALPKPSQIWHTIATSNPTVPSGMCGYLQSLVEAKGNLDNRRK
jgi:flagellar motor component MotA